MARVLLFGKLRDVAGWRERAVSPAPASLAALRALLALDDPDLAAALAGPGIQAVVNRQMVRGDHPLVAGDEVAFLPPMSGG